MVAAESLDATYSMNSLLKIVALTKKIMNCCDKILDMKLHFDVVVSVSHPQHIQNVKGEVAHNLFSRFCLKLLLNFAT